MNEKQFKLLWKTVQLSLFFIPMIIMVFVYTPYEISWDKHYIDNVNDRVLSYEGGEKMTDFTEAEIVKYDTQGQYEKKVWRQQNKEIYYLSNLGSGAIIGFFLQMFNIFWAMFWRLNWGEDDEDD